MESLRQTGRTTRMLLEAVAAAIDGTKVRVIVNNEKYVNKLRQEQWTKYPNMEFISMGKLKNFDWVTMCDRTVPETTKVFVNHSCIEQLFGRMLTELHKYDLKSD